MTDQATDIGVFAQNLVASANFKALMKQLKNEAIDRWANGSPTPAAREDAFRDLHALGRLETKLSALADDKRIAERKAVQAQARADKKSPVY
jgi:hypothetical protein